MSATAEQPSRRVVFVAGAGRSGTSTMVGLLRILGLHVPQPEIEPDESNPKGFGEPAWVVEHHDRLLHEALVQVNDSRPDAWAATARVASRADAQQRTTDWLGRQFAEQPALVVKDPRLSWFLPMWQQAAAATGAAPGYVTMLRPPAEVVGSKQTYYANRLGPAHLTASWLNMLLHTELLTRPEAGARRVFVRYADLLTDWRTATTHVRDALGLPHTLGAEQVAEGDRFVDPTLRRMTHGLDDLGLPSRLHELVTEAWRSLDALAAPGGDTPAAYDALDQIRSSYVDLYAESEAISRSSVVAARFEMRQQIDAMREEGGNELEPMPVKHLADLVPHDVRAMIPPKVRKGIRRAFPRR